MIREKYCSWVFCLILLYSVCLICEVLAASDAQAWEFTTNGEFEYRLRYWGRTGPRDLYGNQQEQLEAYPNGDGYVGLAGPSCYQGAALPQASAVSPLSGAPYRIARGGFSRWGSDAHVTDMRFTFRPTIKINEALSFQAVLTFGGFRHKYAMNRYDRETARAWWPGGTVQVFGWPWWLFNPATVLGPTGTWHNFSNNLMPGVPPFERYYMSQTSSSAFNTVAIVSVEQMKVLVGLPIGLLSLGTKSFSIGTGATYGWNSREEAIYLTVPYGPLAFHLYVFPFQQISNRNRVILSSMWRQSPDSDGQADYHLGGMVTYGQGPLEVGAAYFTEAGHPVLVGSDFDVTWYEGLLYCKYFDGRFFVNAEYAWDNATVRELGGRPLTTVVVDGLRDTRLSFVEAYHSFLEVGFLAGPAKLSFVWAQSSGPVLNTGNRTKRYATMPINYQAMDPYQYLIFHTYSGGNHKSIQPLQWSMNEDGTGQMADAVAFATRLDWALAANLNIWGSYLWAHRLERNGYLAGAFGTFPSFDFGANPGNDTTTQSEAQQFKAVNAGVAPAGLNPYVDDGFLGWEADIGLDWKLLEGFTLSARYAYWQPGGWFTQAYKAIRNTPQGRQGNGILEDRDAVQALTFSFTASF